MQARVAQYLNEIVSLSMLLALAAALIAGEAGAAADAAAAADQHTVVAEIEFSIRHKGE